MTPPAVMPASNVLSTHLGTPIPGARNTGSGRRRPKSETATSRSTGLRIGRQDPIAKAAVHNEALHPTEVHGERRTLRFAVEPSALQRYRIVSVKKTGSAPKPLAPGSLQPARTDRWGIR